jgi:ribosomal protein S18 acetylase RimI-like enzyme
MQTRFQRPAPAQSTTQPVAIRTMGTAEVDRLESLWLALHHHHQAVSPHLGPFVADEESWPIIRELLAESAEEDLLLDAFDEDRITGLVSAAVYDVQSLPSYSDTWRTGALVGEIKFLVVAPDDRSRGTGAALTAAVDAALAARGVDDHFVGAIAPNEGAIRFYQSRGFRPAWLELTRF